MRPLVLALLLLTATGCATSEETPPAPPQLPRYPTVAQLTHATVAQRELDRTAQFHLTGITSGASAQSMSGDGAVRYQPDGLAMQLTQHLQPPGGRPGPAFTLVILRDGAYLRPPPGAAPMMPPGKSWFRIVDNTTSPAMTAFSRSVQSLRQNADPTQGFSQLGNAVRIVDSGQELLDGVWAVRYRISLDLVRAAGLATDPATKQTLDYLVQAGAKTDDTTLWLDGDNRLLRMVLVRNLPSENGVTTYTLTTRYRGWGQPVQISPPVPDQVVTN